VPIKKKSDLKLRESSVSAKNDAILLSKKKQAPKKMPVKKSAISVKVSPEFTMKQVKEIVALIKDAGTFTTFTYKTEEFEIEISVGSPNVSVAAVNSAAQPVMAISPPNTRGIELTAIQLSSSERLIISPMMGTFYRRPSPNSAPFVEVGDLVEATTDICIVEVMKLLSTITADYSGRVARILVEDGSSIDVGQPLMVIEII